MFSAHAQLGMEAVFCACAVGHGGCGQSSRVALQVIGGHTSGPFQKCGVKQSEEFSVKGDGI